MTFVEAHQAAFNDHGFCARAESDPEFDRECFSPKGESFDPDIVNSASQPLVCGRSAGEYRAYLPRARWIRDANDSYFAAMTYPQGLPTSMQPADIHDATWGVLSAVYGGAVHPSAEGHAAMADAVLPAAAAVLRLDAAEARRAARAAVAGGIDAAAIGRSAKQAVGVAEGDARHRHSRNSGGLVVNARRHVSAFHGERTETAGFRTRPFSSCR